MLDRNQATPAGAVVEDPPASICNLGPILGQPFPPECLPPVTPVPALGEAALWLLVVIMAAVGAYLVRRSARG